MLRLTLLASLLFTGLGACSQAYSDGRSAPPSAPMLVAVDTPPPATAAPYGVEIRGDNGAAMATFQQGGRFYVLGDAGQRYVIHVTNPTDRRVEAVVSVDGLDVIDGEEGDLAKRGYVVPPHGDLDIEGFRTSTSDVATFRFSSVGESYAARKGKARNVGVIAVALFDEVAQPQQQIVQPGPVDAGKYADDAIGGGYRPSEVDGRLDRSATLEGGHGSGSGSAVASQGLMQPPTPDTCCAKTPARGGLGTEYGETRTSATTWTQFVRASATPTAVSELRYNDAAGLAALGIDLAPRVTTDEITKRETADPFPGDPSFSRAP